MEGSGRARPEPPLLWAGEEMHQNQAPSRDQLPGLQRPEAAAQVHLFALRREDRPPGQPVQQVLQASFRFLRPSGPFFEFICLPPSQSPPPLAIPDNA